MDIKLGLVRDVLANGGVKITLDGEDSPRQKEFNTIGNYKPNIGDRVALGKQGEDYLLLGDIKPLTNQEDTGQVYNWDKFSLTDVAEMIEHVEQHEERKLDISPHFTSVGNVIDGFSYFDWDPTGNGYKVTSNYTGHVSFFKSFTGDYVLNQSNGHITYTETKRKVFVNKKGKGDLIERVTSKNREAYPDSGELNGFWYEFKG